ncbi:ADP-ribosylation factor 6 [Arthroderma uncinatum]|uniref:ADP-ribosylation factor 6 n=1 Tax=Arthroderma uncinatum TaxID=74035 RepID=UPI00144A7BFF|nr:ADP-ribosylation factor 6 [Arthroderma uncinatum]KAF3491313.1 ADP-ribosylation factor 6 [Arthroderma uncinatum]
MGGQVSKLMGKIFGSKEMRLLMLGLDAAGKTSTQGLIFVIDSNDRARIDEARQELHRIILDREMKEALLLVFANKQDIPGAMSPQEVTEKLQLSQLKDRIWTT